jgi:chromosome segregation ATPase
MPLKQPAELLVEAHEDRIQKLEEEQQTVKVEVAVIKEHIDTGFKYLGQQIETATSPIKELAEHTTKANARLEKLEEKEQKRKDLVSTLKKGGWAVALTIFGGLVKHIIDHWPF